MKSLPQLLRDSAKLHAASPAIHAGDRTVTHGEFDEASDRVAASISGWGIRKGDRVGLYCINGDAFATAYFGILKAGATVVPLNLMLNPKEVAFILNDAGAKGLIYHELFAEAVRSIADSLSNIELRVCIGEKNPLADVLWSEVLQNVSPCPQPDLDPAKDLAAILYTAGTTGFPKGAMLTHNNLASNADSIRLALQLAPGKDVILCVLPMFHAFAATVCMIFPLLNGCSLVALPKFDPQLLADVVERHGVTVLPMVPSMFNVLLRLPDAVVAKFATVRFAISGGAAMPVEIMRQFEAKFGKFIYEGDGPTECSPCTCVNPIGGVRKPGTVGVCVPNVDMEIRDDAGKELPLGQVGEICVKGPNVMKGYWNHPEETKASFFGSWFRTGDLGTEDADGYFTIVDRKKDMIIVNGMNVYPRIVEECLYKHPSIREAAVVGEPDELHGEVPVAFVTLKEGTQLTPAEVRAYCRDNLGRHEVPRKAFILADLPKSAAGKILKRELRKHGELERGVDSRKPEPS